jgi:hypothetical protein
MPAAAAKACASPVPSSLLITMPATPTLPPSLRKYSTAEQTLLATYSDCRSLRADDDHLLAHVAGDRQAEAAADHVAEEVEQHVVEAPVVEAELLQRLETVDDAAPAAAAADLGPAELHGEDAVALEADIADGDRLAGELLLRARSR